MAFTRESLGESLFAIVGRSYRDLPATIEALACALVSHGRLEALVMHFDDIGLLTVERQSGRPISHWDAPSIGLVEPGTAEPFSAHPPSAYGITYAGRLLGWVKARSARSGEIVGAESALLDPFVRQCVRLVMRDRLEKWSLGRLGHPLRLIGLSAAMRELDRFVEAASASPLPVLLQGEFGTEKLAAAAAIHCCGPQAEKPFVAVDCSDPDGNPGEWFDRAKGGTLYLSAIDCLSSSLQQALPRHLPSRLALWPHTGLQRAPRIIASTALDLLQLVAEQRFSRELAIEFSVLQARVPPLRERAGDIPALARDTIARLGYDADRKVSEELTEACLAYDWPENHAELERLLGRLTTMTGVDPICAEHIRRYAPVLAGAVASVPPQSIAEWAPPTADALDRWALRALDPEDAFTELDPALAKALRHLGDCYEDAVDLADLAAIGRTTPLRMSTLVRATVGVPFKRLLRQIRILAACERLVREPAMAITELAFQVGFGDLSYFERSFRSAVGVSPRQFRQHRRLDNRLLSKSVLSGPVTIPSGFSRCGANPD